MKVSMFKKIFVFVMLSVAFGVNVPVKNQDGAVLAGSEVPDKGIERKLQGGRRDRRNLSSAFDLGYVQAKSEWNKGSYSDNCTFESIADKFWSNKVCSTVINKCYEDFKFNSKMLKECKAGAKEFTADKISECLGSGSTESMELCQGMGETAARLVASTYCDKKSYGGGGPSFFPEFCFDNAIDKCRSEFVSTFNQLCGGQSLSDTAKDNYREDCVKQLKKMVKGTELPSC